MKEIDVIIPTYKPDKTFFTLIEKLEQQTVPVNKIIIMNTEQKYFDRLIYGSSFFKKEHNITVSHISKKEFNHGLTRNIGAKKSEAPILVMMTQDAMPENEYMIENLVKALNKDKVAVAFARQMPAKDCNEIERFIRKFNYPDKSLIKSAEDIDRLGIKTYFCSNVCAAYKREIFDALGGFPRHIIFNEDMVYAANAVKAGYKIAYAARAQVIHSHNYTGMQQFHRNFDIGVSQAEYPEIFNAVTSETEGISMIKKATAHLWKTGHKRLVPALYINSVCRYAGFFLGKRYKKLSRDMIKKCTMNKEYWEQDKRIKSSTHIDAAKGYGKTDAER